MKQETGYNGWKNYETWAVALWIDNDEAMQADWREASREEWEAAEVDRNVLSGIWTRDEAARFNLADRMKDEFAEAAPDLGASLWADLLGAAMSEVDWSEVAEHYLDDAKSEAA